MMKPERLSLPDRYRGCLVGLAVGDALGTTLEFKPAGSFTPIADMVGGGPFQLQAGQWTDDTSMALCLAESLVECRGFNPGDQMERYVRWWREGHLSSTGSCFDIGGTTSAALHAFEASGNPFSGPADPGSAGNGSIMRLAPVPMFYAGDPDEAVRKSGESSRTTHGAPAAVDACRYLGALVCGALRGVGKEALLSGDRCPVVDRWPGGPPVPEIAEIAAGSFKHRQPPAIRGTGYVVRSLEAALWAFWHSDSYAEGCLMAVNLGDDADTTGAVYGQLAGAYYGEAGIPKRWRERIALAGTLLGLAEGLARVSSGAVRG